MRRFKWFLKHYLTVGSIIGLANRNSIVWGSGIIKKNEKVRKAKFVAVRGPKTRNRLLELGYKVPQIYGDPAILLPKLIPDVLDKKYEYGIIPHYVDYEEINKMWGSVEGVKVIDLMTEDIVKTTHEILECERIISSSLHGLIVSHAYRIPALWVKFSDKLAGDNIKFYDYFESVGITYNREFDLHSGEISFEELRDLFAKYSKDMQPDYELLNYRTEKLLEVCPFKSRKCV